MNQYIVITFQAEGLEYRATVVEATGPVAAAMKIEKDLDAWWYEIYDAHLRRVH